MEIKRIKVVEKRDYPEVRKLYKFFEVSNDGEICLAVGGDGTFLKAAREFEGPILPVRGGEKDSLGFHADFTVLDIDEIIMNLMETSYTVDEYSKLRVTFKGEVHEAVNDIVLSRATPKAIHCRIYYFDDKERQPLYPQDLKGDGVIFSGQIGSTAYNYSAHGPIIYEMDAIAVTPITANYTISVVSKKNFYTEVTKNAAILEYDGIELDKLSSGDSFTVEESDKKVKVISLRRRESFSQKLARLHVF